MDSPGVKIVALTHGVFDLLHAGHMEHLRQCREVADRVIVSVVADRFIAKGFIINDERTRMFQLSRIKDVYEAVLCQEAGPFELLRMIKPDIYIRKDEYSAQQQPEYEIARELGIKCLFTKTVPPHTTEIVKRIWDLKEKYDKR